MEPTTRFKIDWDAIIYNDGPKRSIIELEEALRSLVPKNEGEIISFINNKAYMLYFGHLYACGAWIIVHKGDLRDYTERIQVKDSIATMLMTANTYVYKIHKDTVGGVVERRLLPNRD